MKDWEDRVRRKGSMAVMDDDDDDDDDDTSGMRHACVSKKVNMVLNVHRNYEA